MRHLRLALTAGALALTGLALAPTPAEAHDGWRRGRGWGGPPPRAYYYAPRPPRAYYAPPPRVYYAPPPRVYYAPPPPPVYYAPAPSAGVYFRF